MRRKRKRAATTRTEAASIVRRREHIVKHQDHTGVTDIAEFTGADAALARIRAIYGRGAGPDRMTPPPFV